MSTFARPEHHGHAFYLRNRSFNPLASHNLRSSIYQLKQPIVQRSLLLHQDPVHCFQSMHAERVKKDQAQTADK